MSRVCFLLSFFRCVHVVCPCYWYTPPQASIQSVTTTHFWAQWTNVVVASPFASCSNIMFSWHSLEIHINMKTLYEISAHIFQITLLTFAFEKHFLTKNGFLTMSCPKSKSTSTFFIHHGMYTFTIKLKVQSKIQNFYFPWNSTWNARRVKNTSNRIGTFYLPIWKTLRLSYLETKLLVYIFIILFTQKKTLFFF